MGWTASYQILRDRPLDDVELAALDDFIAQHNRPPWEGEGFGLVVTRDARADRVLGDGWQKLPMTTDESEDHGRLCDVLNALSSVIAGVEVRITDDFGMFGWDAGARTVTLHDGPGPDLVDVSSADRAQWKHPAAWLPGRVRPLPAERAGGGALDDEQVGDALVELANLDADHPSRAALEARLAAVAPRVLAERGLDRYGDVARSGAAWKLVGAALESLDDLAPLADRFLAVWAAPHGIYWYGDMSFSDRVRDAWAPIAAVEARMRADLADSVAGHHEEIAHRRAEHAAKMLGRARTPAALLALLDAAHTLRGRPMASDVKYHTYEGIHHGLAIAGVPAVVPSLLLELGTSGRWLRQHVSAVAALAKLAPARVAPLLIHLADAGEMLWELVPALEQVGGAEAIAALARVCEAPVDRDRDRAAAALRELGVEPPALVAAPPPEALVAHRSAHVRERALRALDELDDPAQVGSMLAAIALDAAIRRRFGDDSGRSWKAIERLPPALRRAPLEQKLAWVRGEGAATLPPQVAWPEIAGDLAALVASVPRPWPRLDAATEAALIAEEVAIIAALRDGTLAAAADTAGVIAPAPIVLAASDPIVAAEAAASDSVGATTPAQSAPIAATTPAASDPIAATTPAATAPTADGATTTLMDDLITVLAKEQAVPPELVTRAGLSPSVAGLDRWDRSKAVRARLLELGPAQVGLRVIARLPELHDGNLRELCEHALPAAAADAAVPPRLVELWEDAHTQPWESPGRLADLFESVAAVPALFAAAIDEIAAPDDGKLRTRTSSAFELLAHARAHADLGAAAVVARIRIDRGRPRDLIGWRTDAYRTLRKLGSTDAMPTAILELAELVTVGRTSALIELLARGGAGERDVLIQAIDLPELACDATRELCRSGLLANDGVAAYLAHPYWKVRLIAADAQRDYARCKVETFAVWAAIDAAGLVVPEQDRKYARPDGAPAGASWDDLARVHGRPIALPPLPPARDGLASRCADHRAWALWAIDEVADPADAPARIFADELDRALVAHGHPRNGPRWPRWRAKLSALPLDRRARLAWARAQADAALSPELVRVRDDGAEAVAAAMPRPHLVLPDARRAELLALEAPIAARGEALFRDGPPRS